MILPEMISEIWRNIQDLYNTFTESHLFIKLAVVFTFCNDHINTCAQKVYNSNKIVKTSVDFTSDTCKHMYYNFINVKYEPTCSDVWYCIIGSYYDSVSNNVVNYTNTEHYQTIFGKVEDDGIAEYYTTSKNILDYSMSKLGTIYDGLFIMKYFQYYITRVMFNKSILPNVDELVKSKVKFLSVEYIHPELNNPLTLEIDDGFFVEGNELFNVTFVKRILEYQTKKYVFDDRYRILIMDNKMNLINLKSDNYIILGLNGYDIKIS